MKELKEKLYRYCLEYTEQRMATASKAIADAEDASRAETKSSAGDKYETGRAMMQQEIDRNRQQLAEAAKLKHALEKINISRPANKVQAGSLVITDKGNFFLAISAGQLSIDGKNYYAVSQASPVGLKLMGLGRGDVASFNGKNFSILDVF